ncbi:N-acetylmuramoyl-L-alanine amidase [Gemmatimonas sp.]|uniref:N-acetylmuramoyl-L-alanine amidase family protein n=1 Tax=Gemmatimonas sp. TaxID=1962908 RepID=UPI00286D74AE|nr:N-acetylmuramoyl-L-alanine amidase [Gemmatimonas sp.]
MMLLSALALTLQLSAVAPPLPPLPPLVVRAGDRLQSVPTLRHPDGGIAVRADALAQALGGQLVTQSTGSARFRLEVGTTGMDLEAGNALVVVASDTIPLRAGVFRRGGQLYVPLALATELLPRLGAGVLFDPEKAELRRFSTVTTARRAPTARPRAETPRSSAPSAPADNVRSAPARRSASLRQRVVVVDAGHGGPDNGMSGPIGVPKKVYEKNITLAVAKELRTALEQRQIQVVMTRTTDTLIALGDRGRIANHAKADLFLSVHVNAANPRWTNPGGARGFETYFLAEAKTEDERRVAAMENEAIRFETDADVTRDDPLGFIMRDMAQNEHLRESGRLAELLQAGMKQVHPGPSRGVKQAGFRVLVTAFMPAVLVEIGFGTNKLEAQYMTDTERQRELASTLADAVVRYLDQYERKVGGGG